MEYMEYMEGIVRFIRSERLVRSASRRPRSRAAAACPAPPLHAAAACRAFAACRMAIFRLVCERALRWDQQWCPVGCYDVLKERHASVGMAAVDHGRVSGDDDVHSVQQLLLGGHQRADERGHDAERWRIAP